MKIKATIDRIEEGHHAVLLVGEKEFEIDWPFQYLPSGVKEGDIIDFSLEINQEATNKQREKISNLIEKLKNKSE